jgi:hypothetical protein
MLTVNQLSVQLDQVSKSEGAKGTRSQRSVRRRRVEGKGGKSGSGKGGKSGTKKSKNESRDVPEPERAPAFDEPLNLDGRVEDSIRTVQIKQSTITGKCMAYDDTYTSPLRMIDCTSEGALDYWEVIYESVDLFKLRHAASQMCIPQNPETPNASFDCFAGFDAPGHEQAIADSINGLVDCSSPYAAKIGFTDAINSMYIYNTVCTTGSPGADKDVVFMTYYTTDGAALVMWGEKALLDMPEMVMTHDIRGSWMFEDIPE